MTRDFNKQRRVNERPYSRSSSSGRDGEERSSRPARPRLNRDMVDRAWENGARQNHADYRSRDDNRNQQPRDNKRGNQYSDQPSAQNSRNNRKPYGNRQNNYRDSERTSQSNYGPRPRSYESSMRRFDDQRYNEFEHQGYPDRPERTNPRTGYRENAQHPGSRSPYRDREQYRGNQRNEFDRDTRSSRNPTSNRRPPRDFEGDANGRQSRSYDRDKRPFHNGPQRNTVNPRQQSRPARQQPNFSRRPQESQRRGPERELFEGDYEHFDELNAIEPSAARNEGHTDAPQKAQEGHPVSSLNELKGSKHEERKNAEFWKEIGQEADELVQHIEPPTAKEAITEHSTEVPTITPTDEKPRSRARTTSVAARGRKAKANQSAPKPPSDGPKPSQRGFKWPTPEQ